jgi:hypothetical protein
MDFFANIARASATPAFIVAIVVGLGLIAGGIYLLASRPVSMSAPPLVPGGKPQPIPTINNAVNTGRTIGGAIMIVFGVLIPLSGWIRRMTIRSNPDVAALAGMIDVARMIKNA